MVLVANGFGNRTKEKRPSKEPLHYLTGRNGHTLMERPGDNQSRAQKTRRAFRRALPFAASPKSLLTSMFLSKSHEALEPLSSPWPLSEVPCELISLSTLLVLSFPLDFKIRSLSRWKVDWTTTVFQKVDRGLKSNENMNGLFVKRNVSSQKPYSGNEKRKIVTSTIRKKKSSLIFKMQQGVVHESP